MWARLRLRDGIRVSRKRLLRVMRESLARFDRLATDLGVDGIERADPLQRLDGNERSLILKW